MSLQARRKVVASVIAPNYHRTTTKTWSTEELNCGKSTLNNDKNDLKVVVDAKFNKNATRAAAAIVSLLTEKEYTLVLDEVIVALTPKLPTNNTTDPIVASIIDGIVSTFDHLKSKSSRKEQSESMMKNVLAACMLAIERDNKLISNNELHKFLHVSRPQLTIARRNARDMIQNGNMGLSLKRKQRSDAIRDNLAPFVYDYLKDETVTRLDTNQGPVEGQDPRTGQITSEHMRIWNEINKEQQHQRFLESTHYLNFQQENDGATAVSLGVGMMCWDGLIGLFPIQLQNHVLMKRFLDLSM